MLARMARVLVLLVGGVMAAVLGRPADAAQVVRVGGYDFPPFVETENGKTTGLTMHLIDALNQMQPDYRFEFVPVSARRRYGDLEAGAFDVMFFESPQWEWQDRKLAVDFTKVFLHGGEVYVAQAKDGRGQDYFDDLTTKSLVGILGYHYGFAGFDADPEHLAKRFDIKLVNSHKSTIELVLNGRRDIGVVTLSYLRRYLRDNPKAKDQLLVSQRLDQPYDHRVLVRRGSAVSVEIMDMLMDRLAQHGLLAQALRDLAPVQ